LADYTHFGFGPIRGFWQALFEEGNARLHVLDLGSITTTWGFLLFNINGEPMKKHEIREFALDASVKRWRLQGFKLNAVAKMARKSRLETAKILYRQKLLSKKHLQAIEREN